MTTDREDRVLGQEMKEEGWIVIGGDDLMWLHSPSRRCVTVSAATRKSCRVPCWGPEPTSPDADGFFVACRVHDEQGNPMFGDAFWVESYATALRLARKIRLAILWETPSEKRQHRRDVDRRGGEWWRDLVAPARSGRRSA